MSRVGKLPVTIPAKTEVEIKGNVFKAKGPLGELTYTLRPDVEVVKEENEIIVRNKNASTGKYWGTTRAVISSLLIGVSEGYKKSLEIQWVGYKFENVTPAKLTMALGFAHKVDMDIPKGLKVEFDPANKNVLHVTGIDKQLVGEFASKIREKKEPEPYKGKGIRYVGEYVKKKAGKTASKS